MATAVRRPLPPVPATGRVVRDRAGLELFVERRIPVTGTEAWEWLTSPARTKKWIGTWRGAATVGGDIRFTMTFEEDPAAETVTIASCDPGRRFALQWPVGAATARVEISIAEVGQATTVVLAQRFGAARDAGTIGPGWEYYLDRLVAVVTGAPTPDFERYFPAQRPYFERLAMDGDPVSWPAQ
jgi:uncharacterized protein YndB with AHSA1/START domain